MDCKDIQEFFSEYYDSMEADEEITQHLQACHECDREYREYRQLLNDIRVLPEPELPPYFHKNLMAGVRKHAQAQQMKHRRTTYRRIALLAASVLWAVVWVSGVFIYDNWDRQTGRVTEYGATPAATPAAFGIQPAMDLDLNVNEFNLDRTSRGDGWDDDTAFPEVSDEFIVDAGGGMQYIMPVPALPHIGHPWTGDISGASPVSPPEIGGATPEAVFDSDIWSWNDDSRHLREYDFFDEELTVRQYTEHFGFMSPFGIMSEDEISQMPQSEYQETVAFIPIDVSGGEIAFRTTVGGTGSRAWLLALIGGIIPLGVVLGAVIISMSGIRRKKADEQHY